MTGVIENPESLDVALPSFEEPYHELNLPQIFYPESNIHNVLLILNQSIDIPQFLNLWIRYDLKICADGGANRLYDYFQNSSLERADFLPAFIIGDLDSLREEVRDYYTEKGVRIIKQSTQYDTDLGKCLKFVEVYYHHKERNMEIEYYQIDDYDGIITQYEEIKHQNASSNNCKIQVLMVGGINGRFDHTIHSINILIKHHATTSNSQKLAMYYLTSTDLITYLPQGYSHIKTNSIFHGANCGLLPLASSVKLSTKGLKWDVEFWESYMGGEVSSSNRVVGNERVIVKCDEGLGVVFNLEIDYNKICDSYL